VSYPMRIALPPGAVLTVEARGPGGESLALADFPTAGAQVPLPFALELPANASGTLRAAIRFEGQTRWLTAPVALEPGRDDLGELRLLPYVPFGLSEDIL